MYERELEPEFLVDFFERVEKGGGPIHRVAVRRVTVGEGIRLPAFLMKDGKLWGAEVVRSSRWARILSMMDAEGKSYYHRLDPG